MKGHFINSLVDTVGSCEYVVLVDERASTVELGPVVDTREPGVLVGSDGSSAHNPCLMSLVGDTTVWKRSTMNYSLSLVFVYELKISLKHHLSLVFCSTLTQFQNYFFANDIEVKII